MDVKVGPKVPLRVCHKLAIRAGLQHQLEVRIVLIHIEKPRICLKNSQICRICFVVTAIFVVYCYFNILEAYLML